MFISILLALATELLAASAQVYKGFNYGSIFTDVSAFSIFSPSMSSTRSHDNS